MTNESGDLYLTLADIYVPLCSKKHRGLQKFTNFRI